MECRVTKPPCLRLTLAFLLLAGPAQAQVRMLGTTPDGIDPLAGPLLADPLLLPTKAPIPLGQLRDQSKPGMGFQPEVGQAGKDVIWVPTPESLVKAMLATADVKPGDFVVDLGSGDGRIAIAAARQFGARAQGIEYNPDMVALARRNARDAGVADRVSFLEADIFATDFSRATVVTMYLLPSLNLKLRDTLLRMRPGTRLVSNAFTMGEWEPDRTIVTDDATGYFWIVPANASGRWAFEVGRERFAVEIGQQFQQLTMAQGGTLRDGRVRGTAVQFTRGNGETLAGAIRGNDMEGPGWTATRIQPAR